MRAEYHFTVIDHIRRQNTLLEDEVKRLRTELSRERWARFDAEMRLAIAKGDEAAYVAAMKNREAA